jgi:hypothetical protein
MKPIERIKKDYRTGNIVGRNEVSPVSNFQANYCS